MKHLKSIKSRILLLVYASVAIAVMVIYLVTKNGYSNAMEDMIENNMETYISTLSKSIDAGVESTVNSITTSSFARMLIDSYEGMGKGHGAGPGIPGFQQGTVNKDDILNMIVEENSEYLYQLSFVNSDKVITYSTNKDNVGIDKSESQIVNTIFEGQKYILGDFDNMDFGKSVELTMGIKDSSGETKGVLIGNISVAYLAKIISGKSEYTDEMYEGILTDVEMKGYEEASIYLMDSEGVVIVDADPDYIGEKMSDYMIGELLDKVPDMYGNSSGNIILDEEGTYYIAFSYLGTGGWFMLAELESEQVFGMLNSMNTKIWVSSLLILLAVLAVSSLISRGIAKPIQITTKALQQIADLDFAGVDLSALPKRQDETGEMAESIRTVVERLTDMMHKMSNSTNTIAGSSVELNEFSTALEENAKENLSLAQELAAGMEETTATYESISENVNALRSESNRITEKLSENMTSCNNMYQMVQEMNQDTEQATKETKDIYKTVKNDVDVALEKAKAVDKISEMTNAIMDIADQTSLLALNASIEAARAGEAGKGFAVVAEQISHLASQSSENVSNITITIDEVLDSVEQMKKSLETSLTFMDQKVLKDYESFLHSSTRYSEESVTLRDETAQIQNIIEEFLHMLEEISEGIHETTSTLEASSANTATIADKNSEVVAIAEDTFKMSIENMEQTEGLTKMISQFKIDKE